MDIPFSPVVDSASLLEIGLQHHRAGDYATAKQARKAAFDRAETADDRTRSARDIAYSLLRLYGEDPSDMSSAAQSMLEAKQWAQVAASETEATPRELIASEAVVAVVEARRANAISDPYLARRMGGRALNMLVHVDERFAEIQGEKIDQYRINIMGRLALLHAMYGSSTWKTVKSSVSAAWSGVKSESEKYVDHANTNLTRTERLQAKLKAVVRAGAAPFVAGLRSFGATKQASHLTDKLL